MAAAYWNHACAEVRKKDCTVPVCKSPGLGRTINLDSKLLNIQTKEKGPSWTCKRNRTSFSADFRELWIETMGREAREDFLADIGWDFRATPDGIWAGAVCRAPTYYSSIWPLMLAQEHCEHLSPWVFHTGRKHTKAGAGRWADAPYLRAIKHRQSGRGEEPGKGKS